MLAVQVNWDLLSHYHEAFTPTSLMGVVVGMAFTIWLIHRMRERFRSNAGHDEGKLELLSQFRDLHLQGELSEDEYRLIKSRLARETVGAMALTSTVTRESAKPAAAGVWKEGKTEKTGETVQDDTCLPESRSSDEPPNLNSATEETT